jgi:cation diffusion facilitator family transporter
MKIAPDFEFPPEQERALRKARILEWSTLFYLLSVIAVMYLVLGSSQAMKTAWIEDMLSLVPPIVFLIASRIAVWSPNRRFPYGYHRAVSIAFLCASLALFTMGGWLLIDAFVGLINVEHPTIGSMTLFGQTIWLGWLMIPTLLYSALPAMWLGRTKLPLAAALHDKVLHADATMNKADWMTALAAILGILGVGLGYWWADATAAALISISILNDGFRHLKDVVFDLMDQRPTSVQRQQLDPVPERVRTYLEELPWVEEAAVRLRDQGHVFFGEAFIVLAEDSVRPSMLTDAARDCLELDWRLHDLSLVPVSSLTEHGDPTSTLSPPDQSPA